MLSIRCRIAVLVASISRTSCATFDIMYANNTAPRNMQRMAYTRSDVRFIMMSPYPTVVIVMIVQYRHATHRSYHSFRSCPACSASAGGSSSNCATQPSSGKPSAAATAYAPHATRCAPSSIQKNWRSSRHTIGLRTACDESQSWKWRWRRSTLNRRSIRTWDRRECGIRCGCDCQGM